MKPKPPPAGYTILSGGRIKEGDLFPEFFTEKWMPFSKMYWGMKTGLTIARPRKVKRK